MRSERLLLLLSALALGCGARSSLELEEAEPCAPTSDVEICDGVDNDCDGAIDEGVPPVTCGANGCEVTVRCEGGVMPACVPRQPTAEACNLLDDDCDGEVDEGFGFGPIGDVITLRNDELDTGDCTSCKWAFGTTIAPTQGGFLALWNLGLSGGAERPNLSGRPLDATAHPTGPVALQRDDYVLDQMPMLALDPLPPGGVPLDVVLRQGTSDVPGIMFVGTDGGIDVVAPSPASGPYLVPRTVWTGERFVSAWVEEDRLRVAVLGPDGAFEREVDVDPLDRPAALTLGVYPGRVGVLVTRYLAEPETRDQWLLVLDGAGDVLSPLHPIDVEYVTWQRLVGTRDGWLHVRPNDFDVASTRQALDVDGNPLSAPEPWPDGRHLDDSGLQDLFVPRPAQHETFVLWQDPLGGEMHAEFQDARGDILRSWSGTLPPDPGYDLGYLVDPHAAFVGSSVFVVWHGISPDGTPNPVYVRELGCVQ